MPSEPLNRKLTAILYTDVAGYSRLTGGDEEGTHRQVMEVLDYASQQISDAGGKVLRYAGDARACCAERGVVLAEPSA